MARGGEGDEVGRWGGDGGGDGGGARGGNEEVGMGG